MQTLRSIFNSELKLFLRNTRATSRKSTNVVLNLQYFCCMHSNALTYVKDSFENVNYCFVCFHEDDGSTLWMLLHVNVYNQLTGH